MAYIKCQRQLLKAEIDSKESLLKVLSDDDQLAAGERKIRRGGFQTLRNNTLR